MGESLVGGCNDSEKRSKHLQLWREDEEEEEEELEEGSGCWGHRKLGSLSPQQLSVGQFRGPLSRTRGWGCISWQSRASRCCSHHRQLVPGETRISEVTALWGGTNLPPQ